MGSEWVPSAIRPGDRLSGPGLLPCETGCQQDCSGNEKKPPTGRPSPGPRHAHGGHSDATLLLVEGRRPLAPHTCASNALARLPFPTSAEAAGRAGQGTFPEGEARSFTAPRFLQT